MDLFLFGTLDSHSPLRILRGQTDILRLICTLACEERWGLHIERFPHLPNIPDLTDWIVDDLHSSYPEERKKAAGCAIATVVKDFPFPQVTSLPPQTLPDQQDDVLCINMMPINLKKLEETLPPFCHQYLPLIEACLMLVPLRNHQDGYLSIDERPTPSGASQRRGGLHVESAGVLPILGDRVIQSGKFVPAIEHGWGNGIMTRNESIQGGIFLGSNVANTTAVWNCRIRNDEGDVIGPHGSIERLRRVLGPPTRNLDAGEIVWMTDKTPHESLPVPSNSPRRQFFRLVVGEVTAWFADHSTPNPTGYVPSPAVRIIHGNKFKLYNSSNCKILWVHGTNSEISLLQKRNEVRSLYHELGLGHIADRLLQIDGFSSIEALLFEAERLSSLSTDGKDLIDNLWDLSRESRIIVGQEFNYEFNILVKIMKCAVETNSHFLDNGGMEGVHRMIDHFRELLRLDDGSTEFI